MVYLGIDVGTAGSKATVIDINGSIKAAAYGEYKAARTAAGYAEIEPETIWQTVKTVIAHAVSKAGDTVKAISVASFGESFILLDEHDNVLHNTILYADVRGAEQVEEILQRVNEQYLFNETGLPINAMYSLNKLLWIRKHRPDIYKNIHKIMLIEDYIFYRMSGERTVDYSIASRTLLFNSMAGRWSARMMEMFELDESWFSRPVRSGQIIGKVSSRVAAEIGLTEDVLLVSGAHDQVCAALGAGVLETGQCVDGIGTSECITTLLGELDKKEVMLKSNFCIEPYVLPNRYVTLAFSAIGASLLGWCCDTFAKDSNQGSNVFEIMENECPAEPTNLFVLPHFAGSGTPHMDPFSTGAVLGLRLSTARGEIYKACMEGLCFEMMYNAELLLQIGTRIQQMTCVGGGARSDLLLQVKADIMGIPVERLKVKESGTVGLAMLCAAACGDVGSLEEAAKRMIRVDKRFEPNATLHQRYSERYSSYKKIYKSIAQIN